MKKLIVGMGTVICGLIILCTDHIVTHVIGAMPGVSLADGVAVFSLTVIGWLLIAAGVIVAVLGYCQE